MSQKRHKQLRAEKSKILRGLIRDDGLPEAEALREIRRRFPRALKHQHCRILAGHEPTRYQID